MTCQQCTDSLHAFVDDELLPEEMDEVRAHLDSCASCARAHATIQNTSRQLRAELMRYPAPDVLKARIRASLAAEDVADEVQPTTSTPTRARRLSPSWSRFAAAVVVAAVIGSAATATVVRRDDASRALAGDVLASHIRSLMPGHLTDVASTNEHNVKPWFNGRVNLSPPVPRLDSAGFPLIGGRLDYVDGHPAAVVVYMRGQHVINVFWSPASERASAATSAPSEIDDNGYHLVRGRHDGLEYWIVSDLNRPDLATFQRRLDAEASRGSAEPR